MTQRVQVAQVGQIAQSDLIERFYRMLSLNEVILHTQTLEELWPQALLVALRLSGAERGFLLWRGQSPQQPFSIVASRDVDGQPISAPHLAVSQTIAEEAARTGRTVLTINAREDERFHVALSVVSLDLTSVLCVPVRDAHGLVGALYMDHRFAPGVFDGEAPRMMEAFGHQLALAITNVRRRQELEQERAALASARDELRALLDERDVMLSSLQSRVERLADEVERAREGASLRERFPEIAYASAPMERLLHQVDRAARGDIPVVIIGESGTGKELIARAVHMASPRQAGPFVALNCGAVSESLFESEMFGHLKGSFTGAMTDKKGIFQAAQGGTLFLDELGELPLSMQVKLLRVLQERRVRRVGATATEPIDVRLVAATNRELEELVERGQFRQDLYYRLAAFTLRVPALRERREDIALIAHTLLSRISTETIRRQVRLSPEAAHLLTQSDWPGNVRELENALRAACVLCDGDEITARELSTLVRLRAPSTPAPSTHTPSAYASSALAPAPAPRHAERAERAEAGPGAAAHAAPQALPGTGATRRPPKRRGRKPRASEAQVRQALELAQGDLAQVAAQLGVCERTVYRYIERWGLDERA